MGALTQFACTACGKTLKSPKPIEEGKKIKCPHCAQIFVVSSNGAAPRRSGGDLNTATTTRRPTRAEKRKSSRGFAMWATCFFVSLIFTLIVWVPCTILIRMGQSAANESMKDMKDRDKNPFKDPDKQLKDLEKQKDFGKDAAKDFGKDFDKKDKMDP